MALRSTLETIVEMVRQEARRSTNSSRGIDNLDYIKRVIRRHYSMLAESYDWRHLVIKRADAGKDLQANSRYYNWPTNLDIERPFDIWTQWGNQWVKLIHGITPEDYNITNSDDGVTQDQALKWDWFDFDQFEIWPMPASNLTNGLRFVGTRKPNPLNANTDVADIDDVLLSLYAAATLLNDAEQEAAAKERMAAAAVRLGAMKASKGDNSRLIIGGRDPNMQPYGSRVVRHTEFVRR